MTRTGNQLPTASTADTSSFVQIHRLEYDGLIETANRYANLRHSLILGGIEDQTLDFLSSQPPAKPASISVPASASANRFAPKSNSGGFHDMGNASSCALAPPEASARVKLPVPSGTRPGPRPVLSQTDWAYGDDDDDSFTERSSSSQEDATETQAGQADPDTTDKQQRSLFEKHATRSIQLVNLPESATYADITSVVRGGMLLDIHLKARDRIASLSFVHAADANAFFQHVRRNDLYIKNKRVDIRWNDRQYILGGHAAHKVAFGATRNLIMRHCNSKHTEQGILDDLEHIHNLAVVKIEFIGDVCYISTNSVTNAMYARTCMTSRQKYKGCRFEWDLDECAQSLDRMPVLKCNAPALPAKKENKKELNPKANRFEMLDLDF